MSEKDKKKIEELEKTMDMDAVRANENTALGRSSVGQIGKEVATRSPEDVARADDAQGEIDKGTNEQDREQVTDANELDEK